MGKIRRTIEGLALGATMMASEQAVSAQQPRAPEKKAQTEKAPFSPQTGFEELLKKFDTDKSKNSMNSLTGTIAFREQNYKDDLAYAKGDEKSDFVQGSKGYLDAIKDAYEIMKRLETELLLQEKYKVGKDSKTLQDLQTNASSLNLRYDLTKTSADRAKRLLSATRNDVALRRDSTFVKDLTDKNFLADVQSFVQQMRDYYKTAQYLVPIDREPSINIR